MKNKTRYLLLALSLVPAFAHAQANAPEAPQTLKQVAQQAVLHSPEVTNKWRNYLAAEQEIDVARGGFLPRVDLTAGSGRETIKDTTNKDYNRNSYALSLNQMLFDGFATYNEVRKFDKTRLVRYFELLEASESTALEAGRAYLDVLRYRLLLDLAKDNYVRHKATHEQLQARTKSGAGRRVDLEQAGSRLALAEVNLTTELANLHDVSARYQRIVGTQPPSVVTPPTLLESAVPSNAKLALESLYQNNPTLRAAIENIEAAQFDVHSRRAAYLPRFDLRARSENSSNYLGGGERDSKVAEVVMSWNLFNGGSDQARERQYAERKNVALDMREKACRDTRQTLLIAYNDINRLREQASFLGTQASLLEKTRDAYRDQFNIGQRTLLDLLDTENELLSARRATVNADMDLTLAYLRTYAGMGKLLEFLGLQKLEVKTPANDELATLDTAALCPPEAVPLELASRDELNAKAMEMLTQNRPSYAPQVMQPTAPLAADSEIDARVKSWAAAWSAKDYAAYAAFYAPTFTPDGGLSREDWAQMRRNRIAQRESISVAVDNLTVRMDGEDRAFANFQQTYRSSVYNDTVLKTLEMIKRNGKWLINRESSAPCAGNGLGGCKNR